MIGPPRPGRPRADPDYYPPAVCRLAWLASYRPG